MIKTTHLQITNNYGVWYINDFNETIQGTTILGSYIEKERALEVLDEIQKILMPKTIFRFDDIIEKDDIKRLEKAFEENEPIIINKATIEHLDTYVYEMPKE